MGAYAPVNFIDYKLEEKIAQKIIFPLLDGLNNDGITFTGVLSTEIILNERNEPFVTEFNARFNDPDAQTILPLLEQTCLIYFIRLQQELLAMIMSFLSLTIIMLLALFLLPEDIR